MTSWVRFNYNGQTGLGILTGAEIALCRNDLFDDAELTGETVALSEVQLLAPFTPNSVLALWKIFHERAEAARHRHR